MQETHDAPTYDEDVVDYCCHRQYHLTVVRVLRSDIRAHGTPSDREHHVNRRAIPHRRQEWQARHARW